MGGRIECIQHLTRSKACPGNWPTTSTRNFRPKAVRYCCALPRLVGKYDKYENLLGVDLSYLLLDLNKLNDAMLMQLELSIDSYLQAERKALGRKL